MRDSCRLTAHPAESGHPEAEIHNFCTLLYFKQQRLRTDLYIVNDINIILLRNQTKFFNNECVFLHRKQTVELSLLR